MRWMIAAALIAAGPALADEPQPVQMGIDDSLINAFQIMCQTQPLDFDQLDARASAMQMHLASDKTQPGVSDTITRSKMWEGTLTTGGFIFMADEMKGAARKTTSCAVAGAVDDPDIARAKLIESEHFSAEEPVPEMGADGSRSYVWDDPNHGTTLIIRDFKPTGKSSVMMKLLARSDQQP